VSIASAADTAPDGDVQTAPTTSRPFSWMSRSSGLRARADGG
jgi:hypothetical protein